MNFQSCWQQEGQVCSRTYLMGFSWAHWLVGSLSKWPTREQTESSLLTNKKGCINGVDGPNNVTLRRPSIFFSCARRFILLRSRPLSSIRRMADGCSSKRGSSRRSSPSVTSPTITFSVPFMLAFFFKGVVVPA